MITTTTVVSRAEHQMAADLEGETVILDMHAGTYYGLDGVGARIWSLLDAERDVAAICGALMSEYDVEAQQCQSEVIALLGQLLDKGLVEVRDASPA